MQNESPLEIYSSLEQVWPDNNKWYDYTHKVIVQFIEKELTSKLDKTSTILNAGSGGSVYNIPGTLYHVDIAENLIKNLPRHYVASIENLPFDKNIFDSIICVGSVINYCSVLECITELIRTLKPGGYMVLEFERSSTAELWFKKDYGKRVTMQNYKYLNHIHTLWLYSEQYVRNVLSQNNIKVLKTKRFHNLSAFINRIFEDEEVSGKFCRYDILFNVFSKFMAHNVILLCTKKK